MYLRDDALFCFTVIEELNFNGNKDGLRKSDKTLRDEKISFDNKFSASFTATPCGRITKNRCVSVITYKVISAAQNYLEIASGAFLNWGSTFKSLCTVILTKSGATRTNNLRNYTNKKSTLKVTCTRTHLS